MGNFFGMASLLLAILFVFIPLLGAPLTALSTLFALFSRRGGEGKGVLAVVVNLVNLLVLSPLIGWNIQVEVGRGEWLRLGAYVALLGFHVLVGVVVAVWLRQRIAAPPTEDPNG